MKRILITGAKGLLGHHLKARLSKGNIIYEKHTPIQMPMPKFDGKIDEIYNLAGTPSPQRHSRLPVFISKTNTVGVINVLDLACDNDAKVFQASTIDVNTHFDPQDKSSCYREGKRMAETLFYSYQKVYGVNIRVARMGNFYGPFCNPEDGHVIPTFIRKALRGEDIIVFGVGSQMRNFCYVEDMVDFILMLMESNFTHPVYAIGKDNVSIKDLAEIIVRLTNSDSRILFTNNIELTERRVWSDSMAFFPNWEPKVKLVEGLLKTIDYFRRVEHGQDVEKDHFHFSIGGVGT